MKELQKKIDEFTKERDWDQFHTPQNLAKSIAIEAGELLDCFQWDNKYDLEEVKEELADVLNYCIQMADKIGVDPKQIVLDKITKDKITQLLGTPNDIDEYSSDGYEKITYKYFENSTWTTTNNYEITVVNGIIDELQLDNRN